MRRLDLLLIAVIVNMGVMIFAYRLLKRKQLNKNKKAIFLVLIILIPIIGLILTISAPNKQLIERK